MDTHNADLARLSLFIQRILDADALSEAEGTMLLTETEAARQSLEAGDREAGRQHIAQITLFAEALIRTEALDQADGQAIVETAHRLLAKDAD
jgi:hypothetical protein